MTFELNDEIEERFLYPIIEHMRDILENPERSTYVSSVELRDFLVDYYGDDLEESETYVMRIVGYIIAETEIADKWGGRGTQTYIINEEALERWEERQ